MDGRNALPGSPPSGISKVVAIKMDDLTKWAKTEILFSDHKRPKGTQCRETTMAHRTLGVVEDLGRKSMSDLNERIHAWHESISHCEQLQKDDVDELEDHVRHSVSELTAVGLSDEEAFLLAIRRMGTTDAIAAEFAKVNRMSIWLGRLQWMWGGYILGTVFLRSIPILFANNMNFLWIRLTRGLILFPLVSMLYLFPYTKLIKIGDRYSDLKTKANSKTALISATAAFLVMGLSVFFITSVFVAQLLAPDLGFYEWWRGEYWLVV